MTDENEVARCEYMHVHEDIVSQVNQNMPDEEILYDLAELFKIFGDSTRIKILYVLFESASYRYQYGKLVGTDSVYRMPLPDWEPETEDESLLF